MGTVGSRRRSVTMPRQLFSWLPSAILAWSFPTSRPPKPERWSMRKHAPTVLVVALGILPVSTRLTLIAAFLAFLSTASAAPIASNTVDRPYDPGYGDGSPYTATVNGTGGTITSEPSSNPPPSSSSASLPPALLPSASVPAACSPALADCARPVSPNLNRQGSHVRHFRLLPLKRRLHVGQ